MSFFDSLSPKEFAILANLVAITLSEGKSANDNNVLGNFVATIGAMLLSIAAQQQNIQSLEDKQKQIEDLQKQIKQLKSDL